MTDMHAPARNRIVYISHDLSEPFEPRNRSLGRLVDSLEAATAALGLLAQSGVRARRRVCGHRKQHHSLVVSVANEPTATRSTCVEDFGSPPS